MKILICVKQVPGSNNVEVDPITGVLKRSGIASKINPYDLYAIETALTLREKFGGSVERITMGPPQAKEVILECIKNGVLCLSAKDKVRLLPALNIPFNELKDAINIIKNALKEEN